MRRQVAGKLREQTHPVAVSTAPDGIQWLSEKVKAEYKYRNEPTEANGIRFDSKKEARRYEQLMRAMELGAITDLRLQVDFTLIEAYTDHTGKRHQALRYKADFTYKVGSAGYDRMAALGYEDIEYWRGLWPGASVIEDVKSKATRTRVYINKKKMMEDKGHIIREV
jgi:hypothetical protein